jgi:hypothetical protein
VAKIEHAHAQKLHALEKFLRVSEARLRGSVLAPAKLNSVSGTEVQRRKSLVRDANYLIKRVRFDEIESPDSTLYRRPSPSSSDGVSDGQVSPTNVQLSAAWQQKRPSDLGVRV